MEADLLLLPGEGRVGKRRAHGSARQHWFTCPKTAVFRRFRRVPCGKKIAKLWAGERGTGKRKENGICGGLRGWHMAHQASI